MSRLMPRPLDGAAVLPSLLLLLLLSPFAAANEYQDDETVREVRL